MTAHRKFHTSSKTESNTEKNPGADIHSTMFVEGVIENFANALTYLADDIRKKALETRTQEENLLLTEMDKIEGSLPEHLAGKMQFPLGNLFNRLRTNSAFIPGPLQEPSPNRYLPILERGVTQALNNYLGGLATPPDHARNYDS